MSLLEVSGNTVRSPPLIQGCQIVVDSFRLVGIWFDCLFCLLRWGFLYLWLELSSHDAFNSFLTPLPSLTGTKIIAKTNGSSLKYSTLPLGRDNSH